MQISLSLSSLLSCESFASDLVLFRLNHISVKSKFDIEEYSFGQTTLEQVFIEFAKLQEAANQDKGKNNEQDASDLANRMKLLRRHSETQDTMAVLNGMPSNSLEMTEV